MDNKRLIREKYFLKRKRLFFEIKQTYFQPLINIIKKKIIIKEKQIYHYIIQVISR